MVMHMSTSAAAPRSDSVAELTVRAVVAGIAFGLLFGAAAGSNAAGASYYAVQRRYDGAYLQCMYAKGNRVPVRTSYSGPPPGYGRPYYASPPTYYSAPPATYPPQNYPPQNYPPPNYPPPDTPPPKG